MKKRERTAPRQLRREDWIDAARQALIDRGVSAVSVRGLSDALGVTTGAFYWLFKNLEELLEEVRQDWAVRNSQPFTDAILAAGKDGMRQYLAFVRVLVLEREYDPRYDNAIRDWAHNSEATAKLLRKVEADRLDELKSVFQAMGFEERPAQVRANLTYYSQVGYSAMGIRESLESRLRNIPVYAEILTERPDLLKLQSEKDVLDALLSA